MEAKPKLIEIYYEKKITRCEISNSRYALSFHHIDKRSSLKAEHTFNGTRLLSQDWHDYCEHNKEANELLRKKPRGFDRKYLKLFEDMKQKEKEKKGNKPEWQSSHECVSCKKTTSFLLCEHCKKFSIKN